MSILDLENMTIAEKFIALEELWEDISKNTNPNELTPDWHLEELDKREKRVQNKEAEFYTLEDIKKEFKNLK